MDKGYVIEMLGIRKEFPGIVANDDITLQVKAGEVHALLGENGAGKSTLMSVLFGLYTPDQGEIKVRGEQVKIANPNVASALGISMVHQHFKLVHNFTVTENIVLGIEETKNGRINKKDAAEKITQLSERYGLRVDPNTKIEDISVGMQQRVEILKMLYRDAEILIFDEPTAVLMPQEIDELMEIIRLLSGEGKSILLITHKLKEIKAVADRCTVIRRGKVIGTIDVDATSESVMAEMMVGRHVNFQVDKAALVAGPEIMRIEHLNVRDNRHALAVKDVSLEVRRGEILGIAGVDGNGQAELVEAITGLRKIESGRIVFKEQEIQAFSVRQRSEAGIGHIPEDRQKHGLVLDFSLYDNLVLQAYYRKPFSRRGILKKDEIAAYGDRLIKDFDVRAGRGGRTIARSMSGGNQQKAIVAREVEESPDLLVVVQPTRGLDVGAIEYIHQRLLLQREAGKTLLLFSLDLDEILKLSDRIAVISHGQVAGVMDADKTDEREIGCLMAGCAEEEGQTA